MRILDLLNKESLSAEERLELLDEMYWGDWKVAAVSVVGVARR